MSAQARGTITKSRNDENPKTELGDDRPCSALRLNHESYESHESGLGILSSGRSPQYQRIAIICVFRFVRFVRFVVKFFYSRFLSGFRTFGLS